MRIVLNYLIRANLGGAKNYLESVIPEMGKHSEHCFLLLITEATRKIADLRLPENITIRLIKPWPGWSLSRLAWERFCLWNTVKDWEPDILYTPTHTGAILKHIPTVLAMRSMFIPISGGKPLPVREKLRFLVLRQIVPRCLKSAHRVVAVSDFVREYLHDELHIPAERISVIPHGYNPIFHPMSSLDRLVVQGCSITDPFVFSPGGFSAYQNPELIVEAFLAARPLSPVKNLRLVMVGPGIAQSFRRYIEVKGYTDMLGSEIICFENISREEMVLLLNAAKVSCFASDVEACPNIILEALACGAVILAPSSKPMPEFVGDAGVIYEHKNAKHLQAELVELLSSPDKRAVFRKKAVERSERYTAARCAQRTLEMFTKLKARSEGTGEE